MIFMKFKIFLEKVSGTTLGDDFKNFLNVVDLKILLVIFVINIIRRNYFIFSL